MPLWFQHLLVLTVVAGCLAWAGCQVVASLFGKRSRLGSCCAKGCPPVKKSPPKPEERIVFLPVEMLGRKR